MSENEEMAVRGRMMTDYSEARKRLVTLMTESERIGKLFQYVGACMQHKSPYNSCTIADAHYGAMDAANVKTLLDNIQETNQTITDLREKLQTLGLL